MIGRVCFRRGLFLGFALFSRFSSLLQVEEIQENFVNIKKSSNLKIGFQVLLSIQVSQHLRDEELLRNFVSYLGCGVYNKVKYEEHGVFIASGLSDILNKLIPFFHEHPIRGIKGEDFQD